MNTINAQELTENVNRMGAARIGKLITDQEIEWFLQDLKAKKAEDIATFGRETLIANFGLETITDLGRFANEYYHLLDNPLLNQVVNTLLNDKAVVHSYNAIILDGQDKSKMVGHGFHRDMPWFPNCRTSIIVMIPLVDYNAHNGSTRYVPASHAIKDMPSAEFMQQHEVSTEGKAGEAFVIDSTTWHRAGDNNSGQSRPMIVIKYTLAPFKQQIDFCNSNKHIQQASELVKQRLGWNVRVPQDYLENRDWNPETRKFKSGQYDMTNTYFM